jgi:hypothetical protein
VKTLRVRPILREAVLLSWSYRWHFARLAVIPVILSILLDIADSYGIEGLVKDEGSNQQIIFSSTLLLCHFLVLTFYAVSCHRSILLGMHSVSKFGVSGWSMRETRFFLWMLAIYVAGYGFAIVAIAPFGTLALIGAVRVQEPTDKQIEFVFYGLLALAAVPFAYLVGRLSLLLPAMAVDFQPSTKTLWSYSKGNGWRAAFLVGGIPIVSMVFLFLLWKAVGWITGETVDILNGIGIYGIATTVIDEFLYFVLTTVEVAILSLSFKELSGWRKDVP